MGSTKESPLTEGRAESLHEGLRKQKDIYRVLMKLTQRQGTSFKSGDTDEVVRLAHAKEEELRRIAEVNSGIDDVKSGWRDWRGQVSDGLRVQVETQMEELGQILRELIELEEKTEALLREGQSQQSENLRKIEGSRRVQQAYGGPPKPPQMMDRTR